MISYTGQWRLDIPMNYITNAITLLLTESSIAHVIFNRGCAKERDYKHINTSSGIPKRALNIPYIEHNNNDNQRILHEPSIIKCNIFNSINFDNNCEFDYESTGYKTAYFDGIYCTFIGENKDEINEEYVFMPHCDQVGHDITRIKIVDDIETMKKIANNMDNCIGFNTLGYYKHRITNITKPGCFSSSGGLYVLKNELLN